MPGISPVSELINETDNEPSVVLLFEVVGLAEVLQQIPLTVMAAPPLLVMVPPQVAEVVEMPETVLVVKVGTIVLVVKVC